MNRTEHPEWQQEFNSTEQLRQQVQDYYDQISERLDDEVLNHVDVEIEEESERVTLTCEQDDDAPTLKPTSGNWGVRPLERVQDVFVDAIQSAGRRLEYETTMNEARKTGHLVVYAPKEPNPVDEDS